jgi:hypothetical protein
VALLGRYYEGRADLVLLPETESAGPSSLIREVEEALAGYERVATVFEAGQGEDARSVLGPWLSENCVPALDAWYGPALLSLYACPAESLTGEGGQTVEAGFGGQIILLRHSALPETIEAGEVLPVTLVWEAGAGISESYKVFLHLVDESGQVVAQQDSAPVGGWRPTDGWRLGEVIEDHHGVVTRPSLIAGEYELVVGLYDAEGQRLPVTDGDGRVAGDRVSLASIQVDVAYHLVGTAAAVSSTEYEDADDE